MNGPSPALSRVRALLASADAAASSTASIAQQCEPLLRHCITVKSLTNTQQLHAYSLTSGILTSYKTTHFLSHIIAAYALCGRVSHARRLFDELPNRTLLAYNTMIRMYADNGLSCNALRLFAEMLRWGHPRPSKNTYPFVIRACSDLSLLEIGIPVHGLSVTSGLCSDTFVGNNLLAMYMNCGDIEAARRVFDSMPERTTVSWNTMISGYFQNESAKEALMVFRTMLASGVEADHATMVSVLPACGCLKDLVTGREVHAFVEDNGLGDKLSVRNALIDFYVKCGTMDEAAGVFNMMEEKDVVTWTTMINGYILNGDAKNAFKCFQLMQFEGVMPNAFTMASLLSACADSCSLKHGMCLHGWVVRQKLDSDVNVETALIDMYAKCNSVKLGFRVFKNTSRKRTAPWNAVLSGCIHNKLASEGIVLFKEMICEGVRPNIATLKSLLPAYAILADMRQAWNVHAYLMKSGFLSKLEVASVMIGVYSKCGNLEYAHDIFKRIPTRKKDIILWSCIIAGYGMHGHGKAAVSLFKQMVDAGVEPNEITFTSVLHACSHAGLVDDGLTLFNLMLESHHVNPRTDHYTCIVDLLGRAGRLKEAYQLITTMPFQPSHSVWGALLGACVINENVELGEVAANWLFEIEPENTGNYVLMAKIYSAVGRWEDAENIRHRMNEIGLAKSPAHSLVAVK